MAVLKQAEPGVLGITKQGRQLKQPQDATARFEASGGRAKLGQDDAAGGAGKKNRDALAVAWLERDLALLWPTTLIMGGRSLLSNRACSNLRINQDGETHGLRRTLICSHFERESVSEFLYS